ncbi:MAG TPA: DUF1501 domain-containing protein [Caulobacterales bacterium]|nr:DUF1501 domain-containing protein [Caulobacterales bacterium]
MQSLETNRRSLLAGAAALGLASSAQIAFAQTAGPRKVVFVILRGALDGLAAVAPYGDSRYHDLRPRLALAPPGQAGGVLPLSDGFGLHPNLQFLKTSWDARELAIVHAASSPYRDRSHFEGQDVLESGGTATYGTQDGWLNRALAASPTHGEGVAIGEVVPLVLRGSAPASSWAPSVAPEPASDTLQRLTDLYANDAVLGPALARAVATDAMVGDTGMQEQGGMGRGRYAALNVLTEAAARLLAPANGPCAAVASFDGWDTHANQGSTNGALAARLQALDGAFAALKHGLGDRWNETVVVVATEFGRTVAENGTGGTDHGTGGVSFVLGGAVRGGRFHGDWPGLSQQALFQGRDLAPANDVRAVFAGVLQAQWGLDDAVLRSRVFPGLQAPMQGLVA